MEKIIEELKVKLNWRERVILKLFKKKFIKICNAIRVITINNMLL